ncbi:MAG: prepilin-type N-terminal cleavage/methylation domain-containing protein, partial [Verrucomicrobia bacterium]|nr:prepilin-type N-terminal cleavage/methylation domain-containing protein [Verrucomicrobiota bacterium]
MTRLWKSSRCSSFLTKRESCGSAARGDGFTLIELLTVLAIVGILASLLLPVLLNSREQARSSVCRHNLRHLTMAVHSYAQEREDELPFSGGVDRNHNYDWVKGGQSSISSKDESTWNNPGFGFHAESGALYYHATGQER